MGLQDIDCVDAVANDPTMLFFQQALPGALRVMTVSQMVNLILARMGPWDQIRRLRVFAHGFPGVQGLGNSFNLWTTALTQQIAVDIPGGVGPGSDLGRLTSRFWSHGWVELHGCSVAGGAGGAALIRRLAALWRVSVKAGTVLQDASSGFENQYAIAYPNGSLVYRKGDKPGVW